MIRLEEVSFAYGSGETILSGADLELDRGLALLLGPNGCGKSTLLKLIAGVEHPADGRVFIDDHDVWRDEVRAREKLAYVPEHPDLSPYATVGEILDLVSGLRGSSHGEVQDALEWVGLSNLGSRTVRELSKGQRRRAALAAARIATPECLFFDEPLEGMDRGFRRILVDWIVEHRQAGGTVVIVSHDFEAFVPHADRALTVNQQQIQVVDPLPDEAVDRLALLEGMAGGG